MEQYETPSIGISGKVHKAHSDDAAYDLFSQVNATIPPHATLVIPTGVFFRNMPKTHCALVLSRSGLAAKHSVFVLNSPGLIDPGYTGEINAIMHNASDKPFEIEQNMRIAQLMVLDMASALPLTGTGVSAGNDRVRGTNGLGSTKL